jgi:hypothetical protein
MSESSTSIHGHLSDNADLLNAGHDARMDFTPDDNMAGDEPPPLPPRSPSPAAVNPASPSSWHDSEPTVAGTAVLGAACEGGPDLGDMRMTWEGHGTNPVPASDEDDEVLYDGHDARIVFLPDDNMAGDEPLPLPPRSPSHAAANPAPASSSHDIGPTVAGTAVIGVASDESVSATVNEVASLAGDEPLPLPPRSPSHEAVNPAPASSLPDSGPTVAGTTVIGVASEDGGGSGDVHVRTDCVRTTVRAVASGSPYRTPRQRSGRNTQRDGTTLAFRRNPPYADIWSSSARMNTFLHSR